MKLIKLIPKKNSKFVFGSSINEKFPVFHSDSLASAIINNLNHLKISVDIDRFPKISSLFYGIRVKDKEILFIPFVKLESNKNKVEKFVLTDRKIFKKLEMQSLSSLFSYEVECMKKLRVLVTQQEREILEDVEFIYSTSSVIKNFIDREKNKVREEGGLYEIEYITLNEGVFFYFLADSIENIKDGIDLIKISGIGGRRSIGYGEIDRIEYDEINIVSDGDKYLSLSVIFFNNSQEFEKLESYEIYKSRGFIGYPVWNHRTKEIFGVKEGAILSDKIEGKNFENVAPDSLNVKIPRIGKPLLIKVK
ncbi:MAG: hypothetical protein QXR30_04755 [Candidatus Woesearchaeota archaeon]